MGDLKGISAQTLYRYTKRYEELGKNIRTLGWGSRDQQLHRFYQTLFACDLHNKSLLDIGCGFADYLSFLKGRQITPSHYTGWDLNPNFIKECQSLKETNTTFDVVDISQNQLSSKKENFDIGVMLGLLNFNLGDSETNLNFSQTLIMNAYSLVKEVLIVDFLSTKFCPDYPKEDFVFYHNPSQMLDFALTISTNVILKHNYLPIPQKEFMLFIYK
jgi:hypothetical protein